MISSWHYDDKQSSFTIVVDDEQKETGEAYQGLFEPKFRERKFKEIILPTYEVNGMESEEFNDTFPSRVPVSWLHSPDYDPSYEPGRAQKHYRNTKRSRRAKVDIRRAYQKARYDRSEPSEENYDPFEED